MGLKYPLWTFVQSHIENNTKIFASLPYLWKLKFFFNLYSGLQIIKKLQQCNVKNSIVEYVGSKSDWLGLKWNNDLTPISLWCLLYSQYWTFNTVNKEDITKKLELSHYSTLILINHSWIQRIQLYYFSHCIAVTFL